jgi:hypothetical protein
MNDFRRWIITALAVLALMACLASAQGNPFEGSTTPTGALSCTANGTAMPEHMKAEGYSELKGDILINCLPVMTKLPRPPVFAAAAMEFDTGISLVDQSPANKVVADNFQGEIGTKLLFPMVTNQHEADTSLKITNPTMQAGECTLYFLRESTKPVTTKTIKVDANGKWVGHTSELVAEFTGYVYAACGISHATGSAIVSRPAEKRLDYLALNPD